MGLIGGTGGIVSTIGNALGLSGSRKVNAPVTDDFSEGLKIIEYVDGQPRDSVDAKIVLVGAFMPHIPFEHGGTQQIVKDYYPGSAEPAVQVLGPRESDITIKGRLTTKRFKDSALRGAAEQYQDLLDAMRRRGNIVQITLGSWQRYGFIDETKFSLKRLTDIDYEIRFAIVGLNFPLGYKFTVKSTDPYSAKTNLLNASLEALKKNSAIPSSVPTSLADDLNSLISGVADQVAKVTGFVDGIIDDVEKIQASANRAIGMIKYARAYISKTSRTLSLMIASLKTIPRGARTEAEVARDLIRNIRFVNQVRANNFSLQAYLAGLQEKFAALAKTVPAYRHLVAQGDTLQRIAVKYYKDSDNWAEIYKHNKLRSTDLTVGSVLEIPKL